MTEAKRPLKVFLCHAHADRDAVRGLYTRLTKDGVDAWLDKEKLLPGQDWEYEIRKAVREADVVVVCLSKQFNQAGFRQKEVRLALDTAMEQPEGEIFIIPARLEECNTLESLRRWHWVDLFEEDGYERLMRALRTRADKIGVTLRIRKSRIPKAKKPTEVIASAKDIKSGQEERIFHDLIAHYECDFENTTAETVARFLFETLKQITRTVPGVDKNDNSRTGEYQTDHVEYFAPKDEKTTLHALIVRGKRIRPIGKDGPRTIEPLSVITEMLIITVTQDVNGSRLRFDSNELPNDAFKNLVEWILADLGKTKSVQVADNIAAKVPLPTQDQPSAKTSEQQNESTGSLNDAGQAISGGVIITGSNNVINMGKQEISTPVKPEENRIETWQPKVGKLKPKKTRSSKPSTAIVIALIGLAGIIVAAVLNSPTIEKWFFPVPIPTVSATATFTLAIQPVTLSQTMEPSPTLTTTITPTSTPLPAEITDHRGISMRLVRAVEFNMVSSADDSYSFCKTIQSNITWYGPPCRKEDYLHEEPVHKVNLSNFFMDVYEVSNEEYKKCVADRVCEPPALNSANRYSRYYDNENVRDSPVLNVTWNMAKTYCEWRGARLPTEAEWEKAARGTDGRTHPWGTLNSAYELYNPDFYKDYANINITSSNKPTMPVTSNSKGLSPYELYNMAGNVAEWVADWYGESYYNVSPHENPPGPSSGVYKVIRGGSVNTYEARTTARDYKSPSEYNSATGIRCAKTTP